MQRKQPLNYDKLLLSQDSSQIDLPCDGSSSKKIFDCSKQRHRKKILKNLEKASEKQLPIVIYSDTAQGSQLAAQIANLRPELQLHLVGFKEDKPTSIDALVMAEAGFGVGPKSQV